MSIENGMSRRNFLSGAAVAGAAIAGMAGLSACSPAASSSKSDAKADTKAAATGETTMGFDGTGAMPWLGEKPEIADADVDETVDADVVVVGLGGFDSDDECHVYDNDRKIIKGLYACGAPQGGRFAVQYPISLKGLSCGMCMVYGKIAGENAAAGK